MKNKFLIIIASLFTFTSFAGEDSTQQLSTSIIPSPLESVTPELKELGRAIANQKFVRADFTQQKEVKALNKTLISKGNLLFSQDYGIIWSMKEPIVETIAMPATGELYIYDENGDRENGDGGSFSGGMGKTMNGIFSGEFDKMMRVFSIFFTKTEDTWELILKPKRAQIKRMMSSITLRGNSNGEVTEFIILSTGGGTTAISFAEQSSTPEITTIEKGFLKIEK